MWSCLSAVFVLLVTTGSASRMVAEGNARAGGLNMTSAHVRRGIPQLERMPLVQPDTLQRQKTSLNSTAGFATSSLGSNSPVVNMHAVARQAIQSPSSPPKEAIVPHPATTDSLASKSIQRAIPFGQRHHQPRDNHTLAAPNNATTWADTTDTAIPTLSAPSTSSTHEIPTLSPLPTTSSTVITPAPVTTPAEPAVTGCVTTILGSISNPCATDHTFTVYTSKKTVYESVNCHGCTSLFVLEPRWGCPMVPTGAPSTTMPDPLTLTRTVCERPAAAATTETDIVSTKTVWEDTTVTADVRTVSSGTVTSTRLVTVTPSDDSSALAGEASSVLSSWFGLNGTVTTAGVGG